MKTISLFTGHKSALDALNFFLLAALLVFAPLIFGGKHPVPMLALQLMSLPLLAYLVWRPAFLKHLPRTFLFALGLLVVYPLLQWLPLPEALWRSLPGREVYAAAMDDFGSGQSAFRAMSIVPGLTETAWLALLPPLAVFLVTVGLKEEELRRLVYLFLAMAAFQAALGLTQFGGGSGTVFRLNPSDIGSPVGTYVNRNHLAGMLEMALPIVLGLIASRIGRGSGETRYAGRTWLKRVTRFLQRLPRPNQAMLFSALFVLILLGIVFSRSRSGILISMFGIFLSALMYGQHIGGARSNSLVTLFTAVGLALAAIVGLAPVMDRFSAEDALEDARWIVFVSSIKAAWEFFPFGSGLGTFPEVFWRFQPDSISQFVNHVHNDYIEFYFEAGLPALIVMLVFLVLYALRWPSLLRGAQWSTLAFMQVGAGIGLFLMGLHGLTDFNLHIPANAIYFGLLAGVFFHRGEAPRRQENHREKTARPARAKPSAEILPAPAPTLPVVRPRGKNPFAD